MRTRFVTTGRLVIASFAGTAQFFLVMGGAIYWIEFLHAVFPEPSFWHKAGGFFVPTAGLISLLWPFYVFGAARRSFEANVVDVGSEMKSES